MFFECHRKAPAPTPAPAPVATAPAPVATAPAPVATASAPAPAATPTPVKTAPATKKPTGGPPPKPRSLPKPKPKSRPKRKLVGRRDDRYDHVIFRGHLVNKMTRAALLEAERRLGYQLTILQGSYNTSVAASGGTHAGGGVIDLAPYDAERKVRILREVGFAAWHRRSWQGPWSEHVHAVLIGDNSASLAAKIQVIDYKRGRNGLKNRGRDDGPRVKIHAFVYHQAA